MKKTNKVLIIILITFLIILICGGGAIAYVYFATDLLKSNQELFFKYLSQVVDEEDCFLDTQIANYYEKKEQTPYENTGDISVNFQAPEGTISDNLLESVNNLTINFSGKTDKSMSNSEQNIEIDFGQDITIPINYLRNSQLYGLQSKYIGSKYITLENNNLKEFAEKLGMDSSEIPDSIEVEQDIKKIEFTQEEKNQIKETYLKVLMEQIPKDKFTKVNTETGTAYTLTLSGEEVKNLMLTLLGTFKQDTLLINKFNQFLSTVEAANQIDEDMIQELIDELNEEDITKFKELKITVLQQDKLLNQILIEYDINRIEITKTISEDSINYVIEKQNNQEETQLQMYFSYTISGISALENVNEVYDVKIGVTSENETMSYNYIINISVQFKDSVNIGILDDDTALLLNDCDATTIQNLMTAIVERIGNINSDITSDLGLDETENPLLYSNPITSMMSIIYNLGSDSILNSSNNLTETEKEIHNDTYRRYTGQKSASQVNLLINTTLNNNLSELDDSKKVIITLNGNEILGINDTQSQSVDITKQYQVEAIYDDNTGLITEMRIITLN